MKDIADVLLDYKNVDINLSSLNTKQLLSLKDLDTESFKSYINEIQKIKNIDVSDYTPQEQQDFGVLQMEEYANALSDLQPQQSALLLSTQGLSNTQIQQTLSAQNLSTELQYQSMVEAGLLASKQKLTNVELQEILQSQLGSEAKVQEAMAALGLSAAIEGEEAQTVELTAKKLQLASASGILSTAEAQELAMTTGVSIAQKAQAATTMPTWIAQMKAMTLATWEQVTATVTWLATNPAGWAILAVGAIVGVTALMGGCYNKCCRTQRTA